MKKLLLSLLVAISPICLANQSVDKAALQAIKSEIIAVLAEEKQNLEALEQWGAIYSILVDTLNEVYTHDVVHAYCKDLSEHACYLIIQEQKSLEDSLDNALCNGNYEKWEKVEDLYSEISGKRLEDAFKNGTLSLPCNIPLFDIFADVLNSVIVTTTLNQVLQEIE